MVEICYTATLCILCQILQKHSYPLRMHTIWNLIAIHVLNSITIHLPLQPLSWKYILLIITKRWLHIILRIYLILNDYAYEEKITLKNLKGVCRGHACSFTVPCSILFRIAFTWVCFYLTVKFSHFYCTLLCEQLSRKQSHGSTIQPH